MTFTRLTRGDWVALAAALALLLVMAMDWYSTEAAEDAREAQGQIEPRGPASAEAAGDIEERAKEIRARHEKNAWQADAWPDRLILVVLLAAVASAIAAAWLRAAGRRFKPPLTPSALTTGTALAAVVLLAGRIIQKPNADPGAVVKLGAPLGLLCVGVVAIAARTAWKAEQDGSAWGEAETESAADTDRPRRGRSAPLFDGEEATAPEPEPAAATATARRPAVADEAPDPDWAPDWSDAAAPGEELQPPPEQPVRDDRPGKRRRRS